MVRAGGVSEYVPHASVRVQSCSRCAIVDSLTRDGSALRRCRFSGSAQRNPRCMHVVLMRVYFQGTDLRQTSQDIA